MFSPKDKGLALPLQCVNYHGRNAICDKHGHELFLIDVIRPSIEAKEWLAEWGQAICDKFNNERDESKELITSGEEKFGSPSLCPEKARVTHSISLQTNIFKRGRGRPKKNA